MADTAVSMVPCPEIMTTGTQGMLGLDGFKHLKAVDAAALQPDIEDHHGRHAAADFLQRLVTVSGLTRLVAFILKDAGQEHTDV